MVVFVLLIIALISLFAIAPKASSIDAHKNSIELLDKKKGTVTGVTAASIGTATILKAIPSDVVDPIVTQILKVSSYLLIVIVIIFLEKILLTLTGYISFKILIPISCLLLGIYVFYRAEFLKKISIKLIAFAIIIFITIPLSLQISNKIEESANDIIKVDAITEESIGDIEDSNNGKNTWDKIKDKFSNAGSSINEFVNKAKEKLNDFIDSVAVLLITSCIIPIVVLVFLIWITKMIFNINISDQTFTKAKKIQKNIDTNIDTAVSKVTSIDNCNKK